MLLTHFNYSRAIGGLEGERLERERIREEEQMRQQRNFEAMRQLQESGRQKRLENYGEAAEPHYPEKLENFRNEMLAKVDSMAIQDDDNDLLQETYVHQESMEQGSYIREIIEEEEENDGESVDESEVPALEEVSENDILSTFNPSKGLIQEVEPETPHTSIKASPKTPVTVTSLYDAVLPESPSKLYGFNRKSPILPSISEQEEDEEGNEIPSVKYTPPIEQRQANVSLLEELVLYEEPSVQELQEPLLEQDRAQAWTEPLEFPPLSAKADKEDDGIEEIATDGFSKQSTLVNLEDQPLQQPKQAWN